MLYQNPELLSYFYKQFISQVTMNCIHHLTQYMFYFMMIYVMFQIYHMLTKLYRVFTEINCRLERLEPLINTAENVMETFDSFSLTSLLTKIVNMVNSPTFNLLKNIVLTAKQSVEKPITKNQPPFATYNIDEMYKLPKKILKENNQSHTTVPNVTDMPYFNFIETELKNKFGQDLKNMKTNDNTADLTQISI